MKKLIHLKVKELMEERGITGVEMAEMCDLNPMTVSAMVRDVSVRLDLLTIAKVCRYLDVEPNDIFEVQYPFGSKLKKFIHSFS